MLVTGKPLILVGMSIAPPGGRVSSPVIVISLLLVV